MRVAMAYEEVKPLPGLPPPPPPEEGELVAAAEDGAALINPGASGRLGPATSNALGRLQDRFRSVIASTAVRQAALDANETAAP